MFDRLDSPRGAIGAAVVRVHQFNREAAISTARGACASPRVAFGVSPAGFAGGTQGNCA